LKLQKTATKEKTMTQTTWKHYSPATHGRLSSADKAMLPTTAFAFPHARKEPMTDAAHVRDAMARFNQVGGVTNAERDVAFANLQKAASHFDIQMKETDWHQFGSQHVHHE
jgi:hypothetical protein